MPNFIKPNSTPRMTPDYPSLLKNILKLQTASIAAHTLSDGQRVWVRCINRGNLRILYTLQTVIALYVLKVPSLRGVFCNPKTAISDEAKRLRDLKRAGITAPRLLAQLPHGLMMSDLGDGQTLDHLLRHSEDPLALWQSGLSAISSVHQQGSYLSQAFARNIIALERGQWGFFDFEEDPASKLTIAQCQVRDLLFYLHSSVFLLNDHASAAALLREELAQGSNERQACFTDAATQLRKWRRWRIIGKLGRDGERIASVLHFLADV